MDDKKEEAPQATETRQSAQPQVAPVTPEPSSPVISPPAEAEPAQKKKRGRPPGSRNKKKEAPTIGSRRMSKMSEKESSKMQRSMQRGDTFGDSENQSSYGRSLAKGTSFEDKGQNQGAKYIRKRTDQRSVL